MFLRQILLFLAVAVIAVSSQSNYEVKGTLSQQGFVDFLKKHLAETALHNPQWNPPLYTRNVGDNADSNRICLGSVPCGWQIYVPFTRRTTYFMKNTCTCPEGKECVMTDDDVSVSAYVHRCRPIGSTTAAPSPSSGSSSRPASTTTSTSASHQIDTASTTQPTPHSTTVSP